MLRLKKHLTNYFLLLWLVKISTEVSYPRLIQLFSSTNWNPHVEFHERPEKTTETEISLTHKIRPHFFVKTFKGRLSKIKNKGGKVTWASIWGYQNWNFWLISVLKILCLYCREKGGSKSLKMCLCNIWMVSKLTGPIEIKMAQS